VSAEAAFVLLAAETGQSQYRIRDSEEALPAGLIAHAIDYQGRRHLLVPVSEEEPRIDDKTSRGVTIETKPLIDAEVERTYVDVMCVDPALNDLFSVVCDEMVDALQADSYRPAATCVRVLDRWRELLGPAGRKLLGAEILAGLLAELLVLEWLAELDTELAILTWTGPDRLRHDFTGRAGSAEVKATLRRDLFAVQIHGMHQLEPPATGDLYLMVKKFENVTANGDSVPAAVERLNGMGLPLKEVLDGLGKSGYLPADAEAYKRVQFALMEERVYLVDGSFPQVTSLTVDHVPTLQHVSAVQYVLDLSAKPPTPLEPDGINAVRSTLMRLE
jgi:hypothetical protein